MIDKSGKAYTTVVGSLATSTTFTVTNSTKSPVTLGSAVKTVDASKRTTAVKITGNNPDNTILGSSKNGSLYGAAGNYSILGNAGNDTLTGGDGKALFTASKTMTCCKSPALSLPLTTNSKTKLLSMSVPLPMPSLLKISPPLTSTSTARVTKSAVPNL